MIPVEKILTIVPARGGSKGVPRKNIKMLGNKPLIAYTIEVALQSKSIGRLIVSTDDKEIADVSESYGATVPFLRPQELASDNAKAIGVVKHALLEMEKLDGREYTTVVYLEPPAPFRSVEDIDESVRLFFKHKPDSVVSVFKANHFHPILMKQIENNQLKPIWKKEPEGVPRQLYKPTSYMRNGAVYVIRGENIKNGIFYGDTVIPYIMPEERSICIDGMLDWYAAEAMLIAKSKGTGVI